MIPTLSKGAVEQIIRDPDNLPQNPILQVLGIKKIASSSGNDRYRFVLSDGIHLHTAAMLATQLNDKIANKEIDVKAIVKLDKYICNTLQETRKVLIILGVTVLADGGSVPGKIGDPQQLGQNNNSAPAPKPAFGQSVASDQNGHAKEPPKQFNAPPQRQQQFTSPAKPAGGSSFGQRNSAFGSNVSPGGGSSKKVVYPISSLTPYQNRWTIKVRVSSKSNMRTYSNARGEGKLFNVELMDESGEIKATGFNEAVDKFYDLLQLNKVYMITKGSIKTANKKFTSVKNDYEMYLNNDTIIEECADDEENVPQTQYNFTPINDLEGIQPDTLVDIMGIVTSHADVMQITTRTNKQLSKRDITLMDRSEKSVNCTLWGTDAETYEEKAGEFPVVVIKGGKLSDFGGRSLSVLSSSSFLINPDFIKEAFNLRGWYDQVGRNATSESISGKRMGGGGENAKTYLIYQIAEDQLGMGEKPDYINIRACTYYLKRDNVLYTACPKEDCNKKVVDEGGSYRCEKCDRSYPNFQHRLMLQTCLSDATGSQWATCFQDQAEALLGIKANELGEMEQDSAEFDAVFTNASHKTFNIKLRCKMETYNGEARMKCSVVNISPLDYKAESKKLIREIGTLLGTTD